MTELRNIVYSTLVYCVTALLTGLGLDVDWLGKVGLGLSEKVSIASPANKEYVFVCGGGRGVVGRSVAWVLQSYTN